MLNVIMLSVIMLNVIMLSVVMLNVIILSVVALSYGLLGAALKCTFCKVLDFPKHYKLDQKHLNFAIPLTISLGHFCVLNL
jgi:hypothetical protein